MQAVYYRDLTGKEPVRDYLLHILEKRSGRLPNADKVIARQRWDDFKARMDAVERRPPRPAGHDAP